MRKEKGKYFLRTGFCMIVVFAVWTWLVQTVDVRPAGEAGRDIGFSAFNNWFHQCTGVHMWLYTVTDWMGLIPLLVCLIHGMEGVWQLIRRKSLRKVDADLVILGVYYLVVMGCYVGFELFPVNVRPVLIEGCVEASYPSSTTLLVCTVMPALVIRMRYRQQGMREDIKRKHIKRKHIKGKFMKRNQGLALAIICFSLCMVIGRLLSGVHWISDIIGSMCLSVGLLFLYQAAVLLCCKEDPEQKEGVGWNFMKSYRN